MQISWVPFFVTSVIPSGFFSIMMFFVFLIRLFVFRFFRMSSLVLILAEKRCFPLGSKNLFMGLCLVVFFAFKHNVGFFGGVDGGYSCDLEVGWVNNEFVTFVFL